jgi:hypothetical protein
MDFTVEEFKMIIQILNTVHFKVGQSKDLAIVENIIRKATEKINDTGK